MIRWLAASAALVLLIASGAAQTPSKPQAKPAKSSKARLAYLDPAEAGPDLAVQGEYEGLLPGSGQLGAQVIAEGDGKFQVVFLPGGLPGAGWDGKTRTRTAAVTEAGKTTLSGGGWTGTLADGVLQGRDPAGEAFTLRRVVRTSPTLGARPPAGALVLFDGTSVEAWQNGKLLEGGLLAVGASTRRQFRDLHLHLEFRLPFMPYARGQGRGNSGVYFQRAYEVQILDSFGLEGRNNECGAIYRQAGPLVNMCLPPLSWQTYDIDYQGARFGDSGPEVVFPVMTVRHNGVVIHDRLPVKGPTSMFGKLSAVPGPISLQNHGTPVCFRNIWVVERP